jgi:hypothetical protein
MAVLDKLNTAWSTKQMEDATFQIRAIMQNFYNAAMETVDQIDVIVTGASFAGADSELKTEGQAIRTIINACKTALDGHTVFLNWRQP